MEALCSYRKSSAKVKEWIISEGSNRPMRKVILAASMSDSDSEEGIIVDPPPDIIDRIRRVHGNPEKECGVPLLERAMTYSELD